MADEAMKYIMIEFGIIAFIIYIVIIIVKSIKSYEYEKKFADFALLSDKDVEISFFDRIKIKLWDLVSKISKIISHSIVITNHSKKFDDDIFLNKNIKSGKDIISIKILSSMALALIYIFAALLQYVDIEFMKILLILVIGYFIPNIIISYLRTKRKEKLSDDLLKAVIIMNNSFKSGRSILQAIETVESELDGPISLEFKKVALDMSYGLNIDVVFNRFANRLKIEDARYIATSLTLLNKTGGNIIKVFSMIERSFFDKKNLNNELKSLASASIFLFRFLSILPFIFVLVITIFNKDYFKPLFNSSLGMMILGLIIVLYILYIYVIRKVLKVDVL